MDKQSIRKHYRSVLKEITEEKRLQISKEVNSQFLNLLNKLKSENHIDDESYIGVYSPLPDEFIWYQGGFQNSFKFCLPHLLSDTEMCFVETDLHKITQGFSGLELDFYKGQSVKPKVLLIPGLAFSKQLERMGRGKGFYDRYLANHEVIKIGVCCEDQMIDELPTEKFDMNMNYIITNKTIYKEEQK